LTVSIIRGGPAGPEVCTSAWIKGLEPVRSDILLERRGLSCYSCAFFDEVAQAGGGDIALAGFLGDGGCLATAADALSAGHRVTILQDAVFDGASQLFTEAHLRALRTFTMLDVRLAAVGAWVQSLSRAFARDGRCA
jgi:isochorismate hydrolase